MAIEIDRNELTREPWTTARLAGPEVRPAVLGRDKSGSGRTGEWRSLTRHLLETADSVQTVRVVDEYGPCYEFQARAEIKDDAVELRVMGTLTFLR
ncbi:MAG: hypothetical protein IPM23_22355 [Candidatus Melainabacteria bacterium]|nr:hypothetical protein [Candidatus Melainabacteria bacterium]